MEQGLQNAEGKGPVTGQTPPNYQAKVRGDWRHFRHAKTQDIYFS